MMPDVAELKEKLKSLRAENRKINLKNMVMRSDLADLKQQVKYYEDRKAHFIEEIEIKKKKANDDITQDAQRKEKLRIERRKAILLDIKSYTDENRHLIDEIKEISDNIDSYNTKRRISSKIKGRRKSYEVSVTSKPRTPKSTSQVHSSISKK